MTSEPDKYGARIAMTLLSIRTMPPSLGTSILQPADLLVFAQPGRFNMSEKTAAEIISRRRMLGILGAAVALGMGTPAAVLTASDAEAQTPGAQPPGTQPPAPQAPQAQTPGVDQRNNSTGRRQNRRTARTQARQQRRTDRMNRRVARRNARRERAMARQEARRQRRTARRPGTTGTSTRGSGPAGAGTTGQGPARQ